MSLILTKNDFLNIVLAISFFICLIFYSLRNYFSNESFYFQGTKDSIFFVVDKNTGVVVVDQDVISYGIYGEYVVFLRMISKSFDCKDALGNITIITLYTKEREFWVFHREKLYFSHLFDESDFLSWIEGKGYSYSDMKKLKSYQVNSEQFYLRLGHCVNGKDFNI